MKPDKEMQAYLTGAAFSSGCRFFIKEDKNRLDRISWLEDLCRNKKVIHVGCVDHNMETIERKRQHGLWLHERLVQSASLCLGIDTHREGILYLREKLGDRNAVSCDLEKDECQEIMQGQWDYLLMPEVLEHVDNPVAFLKAVREKFMGRVSRLVVTVPNAFRLINFRAAFQNHECINSDHRYWFTPYTLAKVLVRAGYNIESLLFLEDAVYQRKGLRGVLRRYFLSKRPLFREVLGVLAS